MTVRTFIFAGLTLILTLDSRAYRTVARKDLEARWHLTPNSIAGDFCPL